VNACSGAAVAANISAQSFTVGQTDVPDEPTFFHRTQVTNAGGATTDYVRTSQAVEDVTRTAGKTLTLSFYAKANAPLYLGIDAERVLSGYNVSGLISTKVPLTTSWQKFIITFDVPTLTGTSLSANNYLRIDFWYSSGSAFFASNGGVGFQTGTFDIARVQLEEGSEATGFEFRHFQEELALCQRYFQKYLFVIISEYNVAGGTNYNGMVFQNTMRATPTVTYSNQSNSNGGTISTNSVSPTQIRIQAVQPAAGNSWSQATIELDAEL
jgi:hypothetical protein